MSPTASWQLCDGQPLVLFFSFHAAIEISGSSFFKVERIKLIRTLKILGDLNDHACFPPSFISVHLIHFFSSMSQFQRNFARTKLASLSLEPPMPENTLSEEAEEEDDSRNLFELHDDDSSSASSASSTGTIVPSLSKGRFANKGFVQSDWRLTLSIFTFTDSVLSSILSEIFTGCLRVHLCLISVLLIPFPPQPFGCTPLEKLLQRGALLRKYPRCKSIYPTCLRDTTVGQGTTFCDSSWSWVLWPVVRAVCIRDSESSS